jgi:hypothetical protein
MATANWSEGGRAVRGGPRPELRLRHWRVRQATGWCGECQQADNFESAADGWAGEYVPDLHDGVRQLLGIIEERFDLVQELGCRRDEES